MAFLQNPLHQKGRSLIPLFSLAILCSLFFFLGSYPHRQTPSSSTPSLPCQNLPLNFTRRNNDFFPPPLDFSSHHSLPLPETPQERPHPLDFCPKNFTNHCPCHDPHRAKQFSIDKFFYRERHCPESQDEKLRCLIPVPVGYRTPFAWPKSRDYAWFRNVPFPKLTVYKKTQNWVRLEGKDRLFFPGGGTSFPLGAKGYVDLIKRVVPFKSGTVRTVLDVGCGVASFGAALMDYNILTMSVAPSDIHEAQVQFALERGLPAMLGILSTYRLPYPSRVLRPGGYWVLSGPPISWKTSYKGWERERPDLENEQVALEDLARRLCWKKIAERGPIAVWRKPNNHMHCIQKLNTWKSLKLCGSSDPDSGWYREMESCITPLPTVNDVHDMSGGALPKWPKRLNTAPPRVRTQTVPGISVKDFDEDNQLWKKRVWYYTILLKSLRRGKYRNIMDMNAGLGSFAAALCKFPVWVMNVVPYDAKNQTLGIVYERGLIGTYMNWCEAFSTYPRTYDLIHAHGVFSMYMHKCNTLDILIEMHRILRPGGAVIIRDHVDVIVKLKDAVERLRWKAKVFHSEKGPFHPEKILLVDNSDIQAQHT
ncbi:hypothetical protein CDL15_Pgr019857 [Punica granatum]|uniref:Methyltransferase n=1 Tax=Punica granatum TaxID=22663 RepID=A0A218W3H7_PUNGR|nr:hypothetical protein CDL15_Pgr019857 [Punica granatum]